MCTHDVDEIVVSEEAMYTAENTLFSLIKITFQSFVWVFLYLFANNVILNIYNSAYTQKPLIYLLL